MMQTHGRVALLPSASAMAGCRRDPRTRKRHRGPLEKKTMFAARGQGKLSHRRQIESEAAPKLLLHARRQKRQPGIVAFGARYIIERHSSWLRLMELKLANRVKGAVVHVDRGHGNQATCSGDHKLL